MIRAIAIMLMVVDHALLIFLPNSSGTLLIRTTLTRCAEPLFIFVLASLTITLGRPMKLGRWIQIAIVSAVTSAILSHELGYAMADILVSIALVSPFTLVLVRLPLIWLYISGCLAVIPLSFQGVTVDYSPALIVHQVLLTKVAHKRDGRLLWPLGISALVALLTGGVLLQWGVGVSPALLVILIGHPLAILVVWLVSAVRFTASRAAVLFGHRPLTIYATHLALLAIAHAAFS